MDNHSQYNHSLFMDSPVGHHLFFNPVAISHASPKNKFKLPTTITTLTSRREAMAIGWGVAC